MRYAMGVLAAILLQFAATSPAWAQAEKYPPIPKAVEIIVHCMGISAELYNSGTTANVGNAYSEMNACLKKAIKENLGILVGKAAPKGWSADKAVDALSNNYEYFYSVLYNNNEACGISCGTMYHHMGKSKLNEFLEKILEEILRRRTENETL